MFSTLKPNSFRGPFLSICLGLLLIFGSQYFAYRSVQNLGEHNALFNKTSRVLQQTANFSQRAKDLQLNMHSYLATKNDDLLQDNYLKRVELIEVSDTLFSLVKGDREQTLRVKELLDISSGMALFAHRVMRQYNTSGLEQARATIREGQGRRLHKQLMNKVNEIERYEYLNLDSRRKLVVSTHNHTTVYIVGTTIAGFLLTLAAFTFMVREQKKQRLMEKEIRKKEAILKQYVEAIPDGIMVVNANKEIVLLNQSGQEMLGVGEGQFDKLDTLIDNVNLYYPGKMHEPIAVDLLPVTKALEGNKTAANKLDIVVNGSLRNLESNVSPIYESNGAVESAITVFRDITERVNYQMTLENARSVAEKSLRVKDVFLSNVSHEIRTPLNAIIGFTNLLEAEVEDQKNMEYVSYIQLASHNLLELINDVLDFSKIEAGHVQLEKTATSLRNLLDSVSVLVRQRARERGIAYEINLSPDLPQTIETDNLRLTQILLNVCGNAVKFTEKGLVKLSVEPVSAVSDQYQTLRFTIEDTGIGIAQERLDEIFERFVQASESTTRLFGGTGLGLSIVKSLVTLLDGTISVRSEPNKGTTFVIECPFRILTSKYHEQKEEERLDFSLQLPKLNILIAEDNLLNQKLLKAIFEKLGFRFVIVNNGQEAMNALAHGQFDLIVMDLQMPVMDGYTAIKKIRSEMSGTIPIITMTAHALVGEKEECLSIGANSYISKPFKQDELISAILHVTGKSDVIDKGKNVTQSSSKSNIMLNLSYLNEITGGSEELRDELIALFASESESQLSAIREACTRKDSHTLGQIIHKYRSSLFSVGMLSTADKYKELEASLKRNEWPTELEITISALEGEAIAGLEELRSLSI
jgi:PAS domain S-box-containing protein